MNCRACHGIVEYRIILYVLLRDPGTFCVPKILTHKTLIFVFQGPSGMRKTWVPALIFPAFYMGHFLTF